MTSPTPQDVREIAENAIRKAIADIGDHDQWLSFGSRSRVADAVLAAVAPVIEERAGKKTAAAISEACLVQRDRLREVERMRCSNRWAGRQSGLEEAANIARSAARETS